MQQATITVVAALKLTGGLLPALVHDAGAALRLRRCSGGNLIPIYGTGMLTFNPAFRGAALRAALLAASLALLATPQGAWAKDGSSGGSGSDHSGSDHSGSDDSGSGGHGSDDGGSDDSGSSSHDDNGSGADDAGGGSDDSGRGSSRGKNAQERRHTYDGGWRAQIRNGRYQVFDPAGRMVIDRRARPSDYKKF